jgi:leucyl/phenylalanyl-tRNA--protein transferase
MPIGSGIFPWGTVERQPVWYSPDPRMVLFPEEFRLTASLRKTLRGRRLRSQIRQRLPRRDSRLRRNSAPRAGRDLDHAGHDGRLHPPA